MVRDLVNVSEASRRVGVARSTLDGWIRAGRLFAAGLDADGARVYDLEAVRRLAASTPRRRRRRAAAS